MLKSTKCFSQNKNITEHKRSMGVLCTTNLNIKEQSEIKSQNQVKITFLWLWVLMEIHCHACFTLNQWQNFLFYVLHQKPHKRKREGEEDIIATSPNTKQRPPLDSTITHSCNYNWTTDDHHQQILATISAVTVSSFHKSYFILFYIPFCLHLFQSILVIVLKSIDYLNQLDYHCSHVRKQVYTIYSHCLDWPEKREGCSQFSSLSFQTWLLLVTRIPREVLPWTDHSYHH